MRAAAVCASWRDAQKTSTECDAATASAHSAPTVASSVGGGGGLVGGMAALAGSEGPPLLLAEGGGRL